MNYFGTDGIRGIPNQKLTVELAVQIGKALKYLGNSNICIATDTRISKDMLAYAIAAGAMSMGLNVYFLGILPTPGLMMYSMNHQMTGIMVTASHNPYYDNGIKIYNKGYKLTIQEEKELENLIESDPNYTQQIGYFIEKNGKEEYISFLKSHSFKTRFSVIIDCANGATSNIAKEVFTPIITKLKIISNEPDGYNINQNCGSTNINSLKNVVLKYHYDIGFAFDGDGDRVLCVDRTGKIIDGDQLIYILATYLKQKQRLEKNQVVLSMMSNLGIINALKSQGISVLETDVGDKNIIKALKTNGLSVGGENSGHIIMPAFFHSGDGMLIAGCILNILEETNTTIDDWIKDIVLYADRLTNIRVQDKHKVLTNDTLLCRIEQIKKEMNGDCKIIVRASGTEDVIRITVMTKRNEDVEKYTKEIIQIVEGI